MTFHRRASDAAILGIETANPPHGLTQQEVLDFVTDYVRVSSRALKLYERFLSDPGIARRHFAWDNARMLLHESVDDKIKRFEYWGVRLSVEACQKLFKKWNYTARDIQAVFVSTCTGYLCPGLSTYVSQQLGLSEEVYTLDLVGLGCAGALPALRAADHYLNRHPDSSVLVIAVEICSAAIHWAEKPELILSNSIFSDGGAAVLLSNRWEKPGLRIKNITSLLWPHLREELRFKYLDARLCNVLSSRVPDIVAEAIRVLFSNYSGPSPHYAFHSSGRKVLDSIQECLNLSCEDMGPSRRILNEYGNMSSPSVLFVLKEILKRDLKDGDSVVCFAFGAGFSASMLEAQWTGRS